MKFYDHLSHELRTLLQRFVHGVLIVFQLSLPEVCESVLIMSMWHSTLTLRSESTGTVSRRHHMSIEKELDMEEAYNGN